MDFTEQFTLHCGRVFRTLLPPSFFCMLTQHLYSLLSVLNTWTFLLNIPDKNEAMLQYAQQNTVVILGGRGVCLRKEEYVDFDS